MKHLLLASIFLGAATTAFAQASPVINIQDAMGFEVEGVWSTEADLLDEFTEPDLWSTRTTPFSEMAGGVLPSSEQVKAGRSSGKWSDHPRFPTLSTSLVPSDWSEYGALKLWVYSEVATDEEVFTGVYSNDAATPWRDFYVTSFTVDWVGWKALRLPLENFQTFGSVAGWQQVDGLFFSTKIFDRQPHPYTVLHLDDLRLEEGPKASANRAWSSEVDRAALIFNPSILNHDFPETANGAPVLAPITHASYFKAERATVRYFPKFSPGSVSFDATGKAYIKSGRSVQTLREDGHWQVRDLKPIVDRYVANVLGWHDYEFRGDGGFFDEVSIRFDNDGDAYLCFFLGRLMPDGKPGGYKSLLLHSRDQLENWEVYPLPYPFVRFEKMDGHNTDCLKRPPVMIMNFGPTSSDPGGYLLIPEKEADGRLHLPTPTRIADKPLGFSAHSGDANFAVTHGDKVFVVFGVLESDPALRPPIPNGHPAHDLSFIFAKETVYSKHGTPAYIVTYDIKTKAVSDPVFVGFGGHGIDNHNWPGITIDSKGYLHVIVNGHHDPFTYTVSTEPLRIAQWSAPELVTTGTSYASLNCDQNDTLYVVTRCSRRGYSFDLGLSRKKAGEAWEEERPLVVPFKRYYKIWKHKVGYDPRSGRLFLSYFSQGGLVCMFKDEYLSYLHTWPDRERSFLESDASEVVALPLGTAMNSGTKKYGYFSPPYTEATILVSDPMGDTWHLAVTPDLR